jgi:hypothetical protein
VPNVSGSPAIANGVIYAAVANDPSLNPVKIAAFAADGTTGCSGSPNICTPLWTSAEGIASEPIVANNMLYALTDTPQGAEVRAYGLP